MQQILDGDQFDIDEAVDLIKSDPALAAQILKMVNSAYYGLPREVGDIKYAVAFLGISEIHRIMLSFAVADAFSSEHKTVLQDLWFHSFHTALCADHLMKKKAAFRHPPDCWSAALMHDVGKLVYLKFFPDHFLALKNYAEKNGCLFSIAELELGWPTSAYLGTLLCDHWRLPLIVRNSCESHSLEMIYESTSDPSNPQVLVVVSVSNLLSTLSRGVLSDRFKEEITTATMKTLNYDRDELADLITVVKDLETDAARYMYQVT